VPYTVKASGVKLPVASHDEKPASEMETYNLKGCRILVVEDEPLIGMDIVAALEDAGATVEGPVASIKETCAVIASSDFEAALVDANLHGKPVGPIAEALTEHGVPFAFATGYDKDGLPDGFQDRPILGKPAGPEQVVAMVARLVSAH